VPRYFELEISLLGIKPRIWRRILIGSEASFSALHEAIQDGFGWENYHLWEFRGEDPDNTPIAGLASDDEPPWGAPVPNARKVKLSQCFGGRRGLTRCLYVYDFGDCWEHEVKLVGSVDEMKQFQRRLISGERACPPEDCGGVGGYMRMVQFIETGEDPWGDDPEELAEWLGDWRPGAFDAEDIREGCDR